MSNEYTPEGKQATIDKGFHLLVEVIVGRRLESFIDMVEQKKAKPSEFKTVMEIAQKECHLEVEKAISKVIKEMQEKVLQFMSLQLPT